MLIKMDKRKRLKNLLTKAGILLAVGVAYYIFVRLTGWAIPCIIYLITGKYCPGCGVTRMMLAVARLDFAAAFSHNALLCIFLIPALIYGGYRACIYVRHGETEMKRWETVMFIVIFAVTVAFWVLRNTARFAFLAP